MKTQIGKMGLQLSFLPWVGYLLSLIPGGG